MVLVQLCLKTQNTDNFDLAKFEKNSNNLADIVSVSSSEKIQNFKLRGHKICLSKHFFWGYFFFYRSILTFKRVLYKKIQRLFI